MSKLVPDKIDDPANPLQPGSPFRTGNFNKFAFGMCLIIAVFLLAAIVFFLSVRKHQPTPTPGSSSRSAVSMMRPIVV